MVRDVGRVVRVLGVVLFAASVHVAAASGVRAQDKDSVLKPSDAKLDALPFRGSSFSFGQSLSANTLSRGSQLSYNPAYAWDFSVYLNWQIDDKTQLALAQDLSIEWTDADDTYGSQRWYLNDTMLSLGRDLYRDDINSEMSWDLHGGGALLAPTSLASQAQTMILGVRVNTAAGFILPKVVNGLRFGGILSYLHKFTSSNVLIVDEPYPCFSGSGDLCSQSGGATVARDSIRAQVIVELSVSEKWGFALSGHHTWRRGADLADTDLETATGEPIELNDGDFNHWRGTWFFDLGVSYNALSWLGLGFGLSNEFSELGPDGDQRDPLHSTDMLFHLDVSLRLDEIYLVSTGRR